MGSASGGIGTSTTGPQACAGGDTARARLVPGVALTGNHDKVRSPRPQSSHPSCTWLLPGAAGGLSPHRGPPGATLQPARPPARGQQGQLRAH